MKCLTARRPLPLLPTGWTWRWPTRSWRRSWDACGRWAPSRRRSSGKPRKSRLAQVSSRPISMETCARTGGGAGEWGRSQVILQFISMAKTKKTQPQTFHIFPTFLHFSRPLFFRPKWCCYAWLIIRKKTNPTDTQLISMFSMFTASCTSACMKIVVVPSACSDRTSALWHHKEPFVTELCIVARTF